MLPPPPPPPPRLGRVRRGIERGRDNGTAVAAPGRVHKVLHRRLPALPVGVGVLLGERAVAERQVSEHLGPDVAVPVNPTQVVGGEGSVRTESFRNSRSAAGSRGWAAGVERYCL